MDMTRILVDAKTAIDEADLPEDLREIAFAKAIEVLSAQQHPERSAEPTAQGSSSELAFAGSEKKPAGRVAAKLNLEERVVSEIIYFSDEGEVEVLVSTNSLDGTKAGATRELALLVAGARQLADSEEWTSIDTIREVCEHFGRYDKDNFAATIQRLDSYFSIRGSGRGRSLKLRKPGEEELKRLLEKLAGETSG